MILLVASVRDIASLNIREQILRHYSFSEGQEAFQENPVYTISVGQRSVRLVTLSAESIYAQYLPSFFTDLEFVVFISRHSSESGTPTLSVHTPGNLAEAELGGLSKRVSVAPASAMRNALKALKRLKEEMKLRYEVSYESTHHGPSLDVPTMFVELGSSPEQWNDVKAAEAVACAAMEAVERFGETTGKAVLGIGGPHYSAKFTRIALEEETAFGHMIPKYAIPNVDEAMLRQCAERTLEMVDRAVLDWKGIRGEDKQPVIRVLEQIGLPLEKA
jgi:D-aminoacyl-tRNA deacylase